MSFDCCSNVVVMSGFFLAEIAHTDEADCLAAGSPLPTTVQSEHAVARSEAGGGLLVAIYTSTIT